MTFVEINSGNTLRPNFRERTEEDLVGASFNLLKNKIKRQRRESEGEGEIFSSFKKKIYDAGVVCQGDF